MTDTEKDAKGGDAEKPKIVVDDDWKSQARAEKERLAREVEAKKAAGAPSASAEATAQAAAGAEEPHELPPASFSVLVTMIATQALIALQGMEDRQSGRRLVDLDLAKHHIDTLSVLEDKTRGNLTEDEKALLDQVLYQTRMQYVQVAQAAR